MRNPIRFILDLIGIPGDVETISRIIGVLLGISTLTGAWAIFTEGVPWAVFIASGVFFFFVSTYIVVTNAISVRRLPNKIYVADMGSHQWRTDKSKDDDKVGIQLLLSINSMATFELFYDLIETEFWVGGARGVDDKTRTIKGVIQPQGFANISLATVDTDYRYTEGRITLKVNYGREKDKLTHQMDTTLEFFPIGTLPKDQQGFVQIMRNVVSLDYRKLPDA